MTLPSSDENACRRHTAFETPFLRVEIDEETGHDIVRVSDSAALLIYVIDTHQVLLISQARPALISKRNPYGISRELVAGRKDSVDNFNQRRTR